MAVQRPVIDGDVWFACAAPYSGHLPAVGSRIYYFPHGHAEQCGVHLTAQFGYRHRVPCTVSDLVLSIDSATDEIHATISLMSGDHYYPHRRPVPAGRSPGPDQREFCFFEKQLSLSDVVSQHALTLPESGADHVLPRLQRNLNAADRPPQNLFFVKDLRGVRWKFRHILRETDGCHQLTTGWSEFVIAKRLVYGDTVVFMRRPDGELLLGVRRRAPDGSHPGTDHATNASLYAIYRKSFDVAYYPRESTGEFLVRRDEVDASPAFTPGVWVRLLMNPDDTRRRSELVFGTVRAYDSRRAWRMLEVEWDASPFASTIKTHVNRWQVEAFTLQNRDDEATTSTASDGPGTIHLNLDLCLGSSTSGAAINPQPEETTQEADLLPNAI